MDRLDHLLVKSQDRLAVSIGSPPRIRIVRWLESSRRSRSPSARILDEVWRRFNYLLYALVGMDRRTVLRRSAGIVIAGLAGCTGGTDGTGDGGGGESTTEPSSPSPTPSPTASPEPTPTETETSPIETAEPTETETATPSPTPTPKPTVSAAQVVEVGPVVQQVYRGKGGLEE